jgi:hypothetical protein
MAKKSGKRYIGRGRQKGEEIRTGRQFWGWVGERTTSGRILYMLLNLYEFEYDGLLFDVV